MDFMKNVIDNIPNQTEQIVKRNSATILDLNRQSQLYEKGIDSDGFNIFPEYNHFTIEIKQLLGQPYDRVTLFYSGAFYRSFYIKIDKENLSLEIFANDEKTPKLIRKYGKEIFGLTDENESFVNKEILKPELFKYIQQWL